MSAAPYVDVLGLSAGTVLACGVVTLWRRDLRAIVVVLAVQGMALGILAATLAVRTHSLGLGVVAAVEVVSKGAVVPMLLGRVVRRDPGTRESAPLVNVPASLVAVVVLVVVAYLSAGPLTSLTPNATTRLAPIGLATVLVGFFALVTRRKSVSQIVGLMVVDNGISLVAFLLTAGVPLLVELGASLDILLVVVVLQLLATTMQARFGHVDLDQLRKLHD